jgi:small-conductance mechanosensitive channel
MERLKVDVNNLRQQKEAINEETTRLHAIIQELQSSLDDSKKEKAYNDQVIVDKEKELKEMDQKVTALDGKVSQREDENISLKIEVNRLKDLEKKHAAAINTLHSDMARQSSMIAHLKRLQSSQSSNENASVPLSADEGGSEEPTSTVLASLYPTDFTQQRDVHEGTKEPAAVSDDGHQDILRHYNE